MAFTIVLSDDYKWVIASLIATELLVSGQRLVVGRRRKAAKIPFPQLYAEKAEAAASREALVFNCAQRAHQNTLENYTAVVIATLTTSITYPLFAAGVCATWVLGKILYTRGYIMAPELRGKRGGALASIAEIALVIASLTSVYKIFY